MRGNTHFLHEWLKKKLSSVPLVMWLINIPINKVVLTDIQWIWLINDILKVTFSIFTK